MAIRKARIPDVKAVQQLINNYAKEHKMIPRSLNDMFENLRDFFVSEEDGLINGACALHIMWEDLAEIRSLAVREDAKGRGIGRSLVNRAVEEAGELGIEKVFSLTYYPDFFMKFGFRQVDKAELPHKIWGDCIKCHKFPECDEEAVILEIQGPVRRPSTRPG